MTSDVDVSCDAGVSAPIALDELRADVALVLLEEDVERPCAVSVSMVTDGHMHALNRAWRGQDKPTDVLSLECERPDDPDLAPGEPCELGDIVLAPAYIERQARGFGTTCADEFRLLLVHGLLHLLGYDHLDDAEASLMEAREDALVAKIATDEPVGPVTLTRHREVEDR